jgi:hypothetical protein
MTLSRVLDGQRKLHREQAAELRIGRELFGSPEAGEEVPQSSSTVIMTGHVDSSGSDSVSEGRAGDRCKLSASPLLHVSDYVALLRRPPRAAP